VSKNFSVSTTIKPPAVLASPASSLQSRRSVARTNLGGYSLLMSVAGALEIKPRLQIEPEFGRCPEIAGKTKRGLRCYRTLAAYNLRDPIRRDLQFSSKPVHAHPERLQEFLAQDFPGVDGRQFRLLV
jgi:hypothetical protein